MKRQSRFDVLYVAHHATIGPFFLLRMYFVYLLESVSNGSWYIGFTTNISKRLFAHNHHWNISTAHKGPWECIYYECYLDKNDALGRERFLKSGAGWRFLKKQIRHYIASKAAVI